MKIKTNIRAGKKSGTMLSNSDLGISGGKGGSEVEVETVETVSPPVYYPPVGRCVGI